MRTLFGLLMIGLMLLPNVAQAQARHDGRFDGIEYFGDSSEGFFGDYFGDSSEGFFGDPSSGYHGMPLRELDEPVRRYRVAKSSDTPYLTISPERVIQFDPDIYGD